eukprot:m.81860 g.81860  ORF g.81860 m.81860 type:complete len:91 (+) comp14586_c0_seq1:440-712(+)
MTDAMTGAMAGAMTGVLIVETEGIGMISVIDVTDEIQIGMTVARETEIIDVMTGVAIQIQALVQQTRMCLRNARRNGMLSGANGDELNVG